MKIILPIFLCSFLFYHASLQANDMDSVVILRGDGNYPPYEMTASDKQLTGVHIELVRKVANLLDIPIDIRSVPWNRALHLMEIGQADAITYIGKTDEREKFAIFNEGNIISIARNGFFVLQGEQGKINYSGKLTQLIGYKIGVLNGYSYGAAFDAATYLLKDSGADTEEVLLKKLLVGRFPIAISNVDNILYLENSLFQTRKVVFLRPFMRGINQYIAFSKVRNHQKLAEKFANALTAFKKTKDYRLLLIKYGLTPE